MKIFIGFQEALDLTLSSVDAGKTEWIPLDRLVGRILAAEHGAADERRMRLVRVDHTERLMILQSK